MEKRIEKELLLRDLYYSPKTGYRSPQHLWELAKEENPNLEISKYFVKQWLLKQSAYTRFKKWNNPKHYRHTFVRDFDQLQMDLIVKLRHPEENEGYENILFAIDILSRYAFAVPLKKKDGKHVKPAVEKVLEEYRKKFGKYPKFIQFDEGNEFLNKDVIPIFQKLGITYFFTNSPRKASVIERFNRTIKTKMMRMFEANGDHNWVEWIDDLVENYNNSIHRVIKMKPSEVNEENKYQAWIRLFGHLVKIKEPKYKVGDLVRVVHLNLQYRAPQLRLGEHNAKKIRDEEKKQLGDYMREKYKEKDEERIMKLQHVAGVKRPPFSSEIFKVDKVLLGDPNVYKLKSTEFRREIMVMGIFYEGELSLVKE